MSHTGAAKEYLLLLISRYSVRFTYVSNLVSKASIYPKSEHIWSLYFHLFFFVTSFKPLLNHYFPYFCLKGSKLFTLGHTAECNSDPHWLTRALSTPAKGSHQWSSKYFICFSYLRHSTILIFYLWDIFSSLLIQSPVRFHSLWDIFSSFNFFFLMRFFLLYDLFNFCPLLIFSHSIFILS